MPLELATGVVVDNKDEMKQGKIKVLVPSLSSETVYVAKPVFQLLGNESISSPEAHCGTFIVPVKNSHVLLLYKTENYDEMYYIGCVLPHQTQPPLGECYLPQEEKRYVVMRSSSGQAIVVSEAGNDKGVWITGKKKMYSRKNPSMSITPIQGNQSAIKIDGNDDAILIYSLSKIVLMTDGGSIVLDNSGNLVINCSSVSINAGSISLNGGSVSLRSSVAISGSISCPCCPK